MFSNSCLKYFLQPSAKTNNRIVLFTTCAELSNMKTTAGRLLRNPLAQCLTVSSNATRNSVQGNLPRYLSILSSKNASLAKSVNYNLRHFLSRYSASTIMSPNCNEFCFNDYDIIGFDLDCTVLRYNINEMIPLVYDLLRQFLVEKKSYPRALLDLPVDKSFMQKGLIIDADNGNLLKLSGDGTILRAAHGTTALTSEQIVKIYGEKMMWSVASQFVKDPLSTWNGPLSEKMRTLLDYFDFSASLIFAQAVDAIDAQAVHSKLPKPVIYSVWQDIQDGLIEMYTRENFSNGKSTYFSALQAEPDRYLRRTSSSVIKWIKELRAAGKSIFLLTGSNIDFANFTASYALGKNWQDLFDIVVCFAKKPGYFVLNRQYLQVDKLSEVPNSELNLSVNLQLNHTYSQGNWQQLKSTLALKCGKSVREVRALYLGDNLIQDIYTPVKHCDLDTIALCEELLVETSDGTNDYEYADVISSPFWGSYLSIENKPTLWAEIIANYSQMCIPLMETVAEKPITHKFCTKSAGYYPVAPATLGKLC